MQKPHMVVRAGDLDAVTMHERRQGLHVKAGAGIPTSYYFNSYVRSVGKDYGPI